MNRMFPAVMAGAVHALVACGSNIVDGGGSSTGTTSSSTSGDPPPPRRLRPIPNRSPPRSPGRAPTAPSKASIPSTRSPRPLVHEPRSDMRRTDARARPLRRSLHSGRTVAGHAGHPPALDRPGLIDLGDPRIQLMSRMLMEDCSGAVGSATKGAGGTLEILASDATSVTWSSAATKTNTATGQLSVTAAPARFAWTRARSRSRARRSRRRKRSRLAGRGRC